MALIDLITPEVIKVPMESKTKHEVLRELAELLADAKKIDEVDPVLDALAQRETLASTGLEKGIAVPHCKTSHVNALTLAIGIAPDGIDFDAVDGELLQHSLPCHVPLEPHSLDDRETEVKKYPEGHLSDLVVGQFAGHGLGDVAAGDGAPGAFPEPRAGAHRPAEERGDLLGQNRDEGRDGAQRQVFRPDEGFALILRHTSPP